MCTQFTILADAASFKFNNAYDAHIALKVVKSAKYLTVLHHHLGDNMPAMEISHSELAEFAGCECDNA